MLADLRLPILGRGVAVHDVYAKVPVDRQEGLADSKAAFDFRIA